MTALGWVSARTLDEALARLADDPALTPIAGGTDVMVAARMGGLREGRLLDLWRLDELRGAEVARDSLLLGALTTYTEIVTHRAIATRWPLLAAAARVSGAWAIRNRGTLGGNVANASPAADTPPALLAYGARLELRSARGARWVDYRSFHTGYRRTLRAPDELITRIAVPAPPGDAVHFYRKVGARRAQAISKVCFAATAARRDGALADVRLALGSVAPTVVSARRTAAWLEGRRPAAVDRAEARALLESEIAPIDDLRSTAGYRRRVAGNLLEQFLADAAERP
ncbi:MAG TPA: FAD binding domain-containing protein [Methylomirabilota bacterium]|nr:FAD binding domain-containing protein [Methylomirabilota bacterium]